MKEEWINFEWPGYHLYQARQPMKAWCYDYASFGCSLSKVVVTYSKGTTSFFVVKKEFEGAGEKFFNKVKDNPKILFNILREGNNAAKEILRIGVKWKNVDFSSLSNKQLLKYHKDLFKWDEILWRRGQFQSLLEFHNNFLSKYVKNLIINKFGKNKELEYFGILTTSHHTSKQEKQDEDFIELVRKVKKLDDNSLKFKNLIKRHWQKYTWMFYGWAGPAFDYNYFLDNVVEALKSPKSLPDLKKKNDEKENSLNKQKEILNKFKGSDKNIIILLRKLLEGKAIRIDAHSQTYFLGDKIRGEIAKRVFLSANQMKVISIEDTYNIFNKLDVDEINEEYNFVMYWYKSSNNLIKTSGAKARKKFEYITSRLPKVEATNLIKGELAYAGKTKGRVRIILSAKDFKNFKKNEILVTRVSDPSYLPIMKMSKAIITDIGGITCHAAIVSRELRKTCVIGTKIATKVLHDGDLVSVDANKGIVKKIK